MKTDKTVWLSTKPDQKTGSYAECFSYLNLCVYFFPITRNTVIKTFSESCYRGSVGPKFLNMVVTSVCCFMIKQGPFCNSIADTFGLKSCETHLNFRSN